MNTKRDKSKSAARTLAILLALAGCGDDDENKAQKKCETLVETFCEAATSCAEDADLLAEGYSASELLHDCRQTVSEGAHCDDAKEITSKYDSCLAAASDRLDCDESNDSLLDDTFAIPAVCQGVVRF